MFSRKRVIIKIHLKSSHKRRDHLFELRLLVIGLVKLNNYTKIDKSDRAVTSIYPILDGWQKINGEKPVCFGAKDNDYGAFNITKSGRVKTMKLIHKSGSVHCNPSTGASYWGCTNSFHYKDKLMTIVTDDSNNAILPPVEDIERLKPGNSHQCGIKKHFYSLDGASLNSPQLTFRNLSNPFSVSRGQEMRIWYGQDWKDCSENDGNKGKTCVDVYAWYV